LRIGLLDSRFRFDSHRSSLFRQEGHPELKRYSALIKSSGKTWWSDRQPCYKQSGQLQLKMKKRVKTKTLYVSKNLSLLT